MTTKKETHATDNLKPGELPTCPHCAILVGVTNYRNQHFDYDVASMREGNAERIKEVEAAGNRTVTDEELHATSMVYAMGRAMAELAIDGAGGNHALASQILQLGLDHAQRTLHPAGMFVVTIDGLGELFGEAAQDPIGKTEGNA